MNTTINTYDQIADQYLTQNHDRSIIEASLNRFCDYVTPGGLILDIGCGPGFDAALLRDKGFIVHGLDYSIGMLQKGQQNFPGTYIQADMAHLPFAQIADGLWVNASLLHIQRHKVPLVLQEFYQILKPGGIVYISVQKGTEETWRTGSYTETAKRWFTYWTFESITEQLAKANFEILNHQSNTIWLNIYAKKIMPTLQNSTLEVTILDPEKDREKFGTRYCTGGYIFQITDNQHGPLLTGPTYPDSFDTFNGQGIPDAFNRSPLRELDDASALIIGIGQCDLKENTVTEFCQWAIHQSKHEITFITEQNHEKFALKFTRCVSLNGRTIRSFSRIENTGRQFIPISWFPHPFYPHPTTDELCRFNIPVDFPDNPGFEWAESGFICRKNWPWDKGYFQALSHNAQTGVTVFQKHPALGLVGATCSYVPALFPIWGNPVTFSWEPYFEHTLAPGLETSWWIDYEF